MDSTLADMRRDYMAEGLSKNDVLADPIAQFERWFEACLQRRLASIRMVGST